jgi:thiamine biosynthesis lipoprotein
MSYFNYYTSSGLFHGSMFSVMGTQFDILMMGKDPVKLTAVWESIQQEISRLDKMLNRFDQKSEVFYLNQKGSLYPVSVSEELWSILQDCRCFYEWTKGCFDITLQGFDQILFEEDGYRIFFLSESLQVDLGGYGKGYALSKIEILLKENGIENALVNFGNSSILAIGKHPCGDYWPVSLDNPFTKETIANIKLCDCSLSISGNMPSHMCHIVDPRTGQFVKGKKMVSVVAKDPIVAEVLTTVFMIAEVEFIPEIVSHFDIYEKNIYLL